MIKTRVIRLGAVEGRNERDQIAFCAFHSFLVEVQKNAANIYAMLACLASVRPRTQFLIGAVPVVLIT